MSELRTVTTTELKEILRLHALWLADDSAGKRANLFRANLSGANLSGADLTEANLSEANLTRANLTEIKQDFQETIAKMPHEIPFLRQALVEGMIDGSSYEGECACLAGTLCHAVGKEFEKFRAQDCPIVIDSNSPRERWFLAILPGDTPENNQVAKITLAWIDEILSAKEKKANADV